MEARGGQTLPSRSRETPQEFSCPAPTQALEARKVEQARQLIQFYRKLLEYDDQILKSARKGVDAIAGPGGFSPFAALLRGR